MPSLAILVLAVLVLSFGQTDTHGESQNITDADDCYTAVDVSNQWVCRRYKLNSQNACHSASEALTLSKLYIHIHVSVVNGRHPAARGGKDASRCNMLLPHYNFRFILKSRSKSRIYA